MISMNLGPLVGFSAEYIVHVAGAYNMLPYSSREVIYAASWAIGCISDVWMTTLGCSSCVHALL